MSRSDRTVRSGQLRIAMVGTRGVPASYGGFETAIEEIGSRLAAKGHQVIVYCRHARGVQLSTFKGMRLVHLPAVRFKAIETLSHTALSVLHLVTRRRPHVAFLFNAANAPFLPILRAARVPTAVHVDGLEWKRGKWGRNGRRYYRKAEEAAVRWGDALIADAAGIADYYREEFGAQTELLAYGAEIQPEPASDRLAEFELQPGCYHLVVARFEPENHVDVIVEGFAASSGVFPLVVVGSAPYSAAYTDRINAIGASDPRIRMVGGVWDQQQLDQLYGNALLYLHGHSVGGTNPSLLRAMGAGTSVAAWDVNFNREVLGDGVDFFGTSDDARRIIENAEADPAKQARSGDLLRSRAARLYDWDVVTSGYEDLARRLAEGSTTAGSVTGRRRDQAPTSDRSVHA